MVTGYLCRSEIWRKYLDLAEKTLPKSQNLTQICDSGLERLDLPEKLGLIGRRKPWDQETQEADNRHPILFVYPQVPSV